MDVETGKDDISYEDGNLIVYTKLFCTVKTKRKIWGRKSNPQDDSTTVILRGASGALRPGRMTFILGPSGAGKTTLLKILAGRKKTRVTGSLYGAGRSSVLVAQDTTLIDTLTAEETLKFAARLKLPNLSPRERNNVIKTITKQLGINDVMKTRAGRLSGGERKRLTIACELLTDPTIMLLDEPTSGLDTVSSLSVARALLTVARIGRTIACVVHQPSSQLFAMADDVILLANGRTLYAGATVDLPDALARAGFQCPQYYNMADYLLEIASDEHIGNTTLLENEASSYAQEMKKIAQHELLSGKTNELSPEYEALLSPGSIPSEGYASSVCQQLAALLWRCCIGVIRDVHLTHTCCKLVAATSIVVGYATRVPVSTQIRRHNQRPVDMTIPLDEEGQHIRVVCHFIVALLLGALYHGAGSDAGRIISNTGCLFFFLLFLFFSNAMPTIHTFPVESKVVLHEHLNKWYSLPVYCASKIIVDLPIQLLCATVFLFPAWYLTSQPLDPFRMGLAWLVCALVTILAQTFGFVIGAACGMKLGLFVIPAANIPMLMFSEFFIPYSEMPVYLQPFACISYFRYAFTAFLETAYGFNRGKLPCNKIFCMFKNPESYLNDLQLSRNLKVDFLALFIWIVCLQIALVLVLKFKVYKACR